MEKIIEKATIIDRNKKGQLRARTFNLVKVMHPEPDRTIIIANDQKVEVGLNPEILRLVSLRYSRGGQRLLIEGLENNRLDFSLDCPLDEEYTDYIAEDSKLNLN